MEPRLPLSPRSQRRAPLPTVSLIVGVTFCALAVTVASLRNIAEQLAHDPLVVRALGVTLAMAAVMLARVAMVASAGTRRLVALVVAAPAIALALTLLAWPAGASSLYDRGMGTLAPWILGAPGILALALSRWRVR